MNGERRSAPPGALHRLAADRGARRQLTLSGLSSAGYLGGKLARGAGPIIDEVLTPVRVVAPCEFALIVNGRNLGLDATFEVDKQPITQYLSQTAHPTGRAIPGILEESNDQLAKSLTLVFASKPPTWEHPSAPNAPLELTIANSDGQRATVTFAGALIE